MQRLTSWGLAGAIWTQLSCLNLARAQPPDATAPPPTPETSSSSAPGASPTTSTSDVPPEPIPAPSTTSPPPSPTPAAHSVEPPAQVPEEAAHEPQRPTVAAEPTAPASPDAAPSGDASSALLPSITLPTSTPAPRPEHLTSKAIEPTDVSLTENTATPVYVTLDRRLRDVQRLPATAFALTGEELTRKGVTSVRELAAATPWLEVGMQASNVELYARGMGSNDNSEFGDPAVATFLDGVYIPRPRGFHAFFFDTERVEINLGPQGPMRSRGGLAGTLNVVSKTAKPGEWEADISVQLGNYAQRLTRSALNVPFGDKFAIRVALFSEHHEPFYTNRGGAPELRAAEDADNLAYRITSRWLPMDAVVVTLRFDKTKERGTGLVGSDYGEVLRLGVAPADVPNPRAVAFVGNQPRLALDHWGASANVEVNTQRVGVELSSSYRELTYNQHTGSNGGVFLYGAPRANLDQYTDSVWITSSVVTTNELRVFAPDSARLRWNAGLLHFTERQQVFHGQVARDPSVGRLGQEYNYQNVPSGMIAGYLDTTTDITDTFRTSAGFRLTSERKERHGIGGGFDLQCNAMALAEAQRRDPNASCEVPTNGLRWGTPGFAFAADQRTDFTTPSHEDTLAGVEARVRSFENGVASWGVRDDVEQFLHQPGADVGKGLAAEHTAMTQLFPDFRIGLDVDVTPNSLVYATFTTGHKSGSLVIPPGPTPAPLPAVLGADTLYATELGSKNTFLDKRLTLNGAAFWYALQENTRLDPEGTVDLVKARVLGVQAEAVGYLPRGFVGKAALTLLDARYSNAVVIDTRVGPGASEQPQAQLGGNHLPRAPRLTLAYGLSQTWTTELGDLDWSISGQTKSTMYMTPYNGEGLDADGRQNPTLTDVVPWTTRLDAAVGYTRPEGDLRLDAFVTNATDLTYMTSSVNVPNANWRYFNPPRQFGLRASLSL